MDFKKTLTALIGAFKKENINYALIGGFALGILGVPRSTVDLDFLVGCDDLEKLDRIMKSLGYDCIYKTENVSQYVSPLKIFGEVDFLHAFRKISLSMLKNAKEAEVLEGTTKVRVLRAEDIIGLKVQALFNNPARASRDYADIEALMDHHKERLDWKILEEYFFLFEQNTKFLELKSKYCHAEP